MDKNTFRQHLEQATALLVNFTRRFCYNELAETYRYIITPNARTIAPDDEHLSQDEIACLHTWNTYENQLLTIEQTVTLLHHGDKAPVWIDMTVWEATPDLTTIDLFCSRRLRNDGELYYQGPIMPFHI
jgi:hypothetical protein